MIEFYKQLFVQRTDTFGRQKTRERTYYRVRQPLTDQVLASHLKGDYTIGLYSVDPQGTTKWSVVDSDEGEQPLQDIRSQLHRTNVSSYLEKSRAGGHLWVFWQEPIKPSHARGLLEPMTRSYELFPSGDIPDEDGLGLLIRAPLGIHQASGKRYPFIDEQGQSVSPGIVRGQIQWLKENVVFTDPANLPTDVTRHVTRPLPYKSAEASPIKAFNESHDIRSVVGQYVDLSGRGVGHCPWGCNHRHNDKHKSFQVFERNQKFWCFTERVGGNAADFIMRMVELTPREFVKKYCDRES